MHVCRIDEVGPLFKQAIGVMESSSIMARHGSNPEHCGRTAEMLEDYAKLEFESGHTDSAISLACRALKHREKQLEMGGSDERVDTLSRLLDALNVAFGPSVPIPGLADSAMCSSVANADSDRASQMQEAVEQFARTALGILEMQAAADGGGDGNYIASRCCILAAFLQRMGSYHLARDVFRKSLKFMDSTSERTPDVSGWVQLFPGEYVDQTRRHWLDIVLEWVQITLDCMHLCMEFGV
jgi:hypothetical protein